MCRMVRVARAASGGSAPGGSVRAVIVTLSTVDAYRVSVLDETGLARCRLMGRRTRAGLSCAGW